MRVGSLFSGCGGTALGYEWAGYEHVWFVEKEEYARTILRKRFPEAVVYGDITEIDFRTVQKVDVLEGGFPCQDISNAGKRAGIEGSRSSLWKYFLEGIRILRPKFVSIENVAALIDRGLDVVLADLASVGYDAEWHCISASAVGAPHRRDRIFIIAYPCSDGQCSPEEYARGEVQLFSNEERHYEALLARRGQEQQPYFKQDGELQHVADTNSERLQGRKEAKNSCESRENGEQQSSRQGWWDVEPDVGRVAHGVPNRVDRIKCLGNAVVPQCAEVVAQAIKEYSVGKEMRGSVRE